MEWTRDGLEVARLMSPAAQLNPDRVPQVDGAYVILGRPEIRPKLSIQRRWNFKSRNPSVSTDQPESD